MIALIVDHTAQHAEPVNENDDLDDDLDDDDLDDDDLDDDDLDMT